MTVKRRQINWEGLADKLENAMKGRTATVDARFYKQKFSEEGLAESIIRFVPSPDTDIPLVSYFRHKFRASGGFYAENCPTTIGGKCPVCDSNRAMWDTDQDTCRLRSRKQRFISNILVINDPATPENNGKVFLLEFDKKVYEKIISKIKPKKGSIDDPCNVFDYYEGANFKLKGEQKTVVIGGKKVTFPAFDNSVFNDPSKMKDADIDLVEKQLIPIGEFVAESKFKPYIDLEVAFNKAIDQNNTNNAFSNTTTAPLADPDDVEEESDNTKSKIEDLDFESSDDDFIASLKSNGKKK